MIRTFINNAIRFVPTDVSGATTSQDFDEWFYSEQLVKGEKNLGDCCASEIVDFEGVSRFAIWSDSAVTLNIYNSAGATIASALAATDSWALDSATVYFFELDWTTVTGADNGSQIEATNGTDYLRSEPLREPNSKPIRIDYENKGEHFTLGSFQSCKYFTSYHKGRVHDPQVAQRRTVYEQANGKFLQTIHQGKRTREIELGCTPPYKSEAFAYQLASDEIYLIQKIGAKESRNRVRLYEDDLIRQDQVNNVLHGVRSRARVAFDGSENVRITGLNVGAGNVPVLEDETEITSTSFTANWTGQADTYDVQISTTPDFSVITESATGITATSYNFTGLTACTKYYYRVRGVTCEGASDWVENQNRHSLSIHLRAEHTEQSIQFDEKITDLIVSNPFALATGITFKYSNGATEPADWSLFPAISIADLQSNINSGGSDFWVQVSVTGFATEIQEACLIFEYTSETFFLTVGCLDYETPSAGGVSKDILVGMRGERKFELQNVTASASATFYYGIRSSANSDFTDFQYDNLADLNAAINLFATDVTDLLVAIHAVPNNASTRTVNLFVNYL